MLCVKAKTTGCRKLFHCPKILQGIRISYYARIWSVTVSYINYLSVRGGTQIFSVYKKRLRYLSNNHSYWHMHNNQYFNIYTGYITRTGTGKMSGLQHKQKNFPDYGRRIMANLIGIFLVEILFGCIMSIARAEKPHSCVTRPPELKLQPSYRKLRKH